jgi:hypothetical protein
VLERAAVKTERLHAARADLVVRVLLLFGDLANGKISFYLFECRRELLLRAAHDVVLSSPGLQDLGGRALAEIRVVNRRTADAPPHEHSDGEIRRHRRAPLPKEERDHLLFGQRWHRACRRVRRRHTDTAHKPES